MRFWKISKYVYCTRNPIALLTASGTGGMEAAVANCLAPGSKAIVAVAGKFGERWRSIAKAFGVEVVSVTVPYGQAVQPEQIEQALKQHPDAAAVCATLSETSTGVRHDIRAFGDIVARTSALFSSMALAAWASPSAAPTIGTSTYA